MKIDQVTCCLQVGLSISNLYQIRDLRCILSLSKAYPVASWQEKYIDFTQNDNYLFPTAFQASLADPKYHFLFLILT